MQQRSYACGGIALGLMPLYVQVGAMHLPILSAQASRDPLCVEHTRALSAGVQLYAFLNGSVAGLLPGFPPFRGLAPAALQHLCVL